MDKIAQILSGLNSNFDIQQTPPEGLKFTESEFNPLLEHEIIDMPMMLYSKSATIVVTAERDPDTPIRTDKPEMGLRPKFWAGLQLNPMPGFDYYGDCDDSALYDEIVRPIKYTSDSSEQDWQWYNMAKGETPEEALQNLVNHLNEFFPEEVESIWNESRTILKSVVSEYVMEYPTGFKLRFMNLQGLLMVRDLMVNTDPLPNHLSAVPLNPEDCYGEDRFFKTHDMHHPFSGQRGGAKIYLELQQVTQTWSGPGETHQYKKELEVIKTIDFQGE